MTKRRALITMVHDEAFFLPIWLGYYSRYFEPADIYVLDHDTTDGSTDREGFVRIPVSHDAVDHTWMVETIQALQHKLFEEYDVVVVTDVDEIIVPNPVFTNLGEYLDEFDQEFVNCHGFELVHMRDREPPYVPGVPILDQRSYWFENALYSKPAIATKPTVWLPGFHFREDRRTNDDIGLFMIHLHRMDYDICLARHQLRRQRQWRELDMREEWAVHNRLVDEREFDDWFYNDSGWKEEIPVVIKEMPRVWRGVF